MVVNARGAIAWLAYDPFIDSRPKLVGAADSRGAVRLDSATDIQVDSLALAGSRVYWSTPNGPRSGQLLGTRVKRRAGAGPECPFAG